MDVRAKLVELLGNIYLPMMCGPDTIGEYRIPHKFKKEIASHLIAHNVTVQEWISVKDRLPDFDGKYLVAREEGGRYSISVRKFRKEVPCWYTGYCGHWERRTNGITHWMLLPQPPKGE